MNAQNHGWFKAIRSDDALELLRANKNAFLLLYVIAYRAQWKKTFNRYNLQQGEALIGDHENYGLSEREYRTAKKKLEKWQFATFKATNAGTIAMLIKTSVFSILNGGSDTLNDNHPTDKRRTGDGVPTTTNNVKKEKNEKEGKFSPSEMILRKQELDRVEARMQEIRESYDSHITWSKDDSAEHKRLKSRKEELKALLGFVV